MRSYYSQGKEELADPKSLCVDCGDRIAIERVQTGPEDETKPTVNTLTPSSRTETYQSRLDGEIGWKFAGIFSKSAALL